jgi:G3E family GTPase
MAATPEPGERLPIAVITGFLGSGKTTLVRRLLAHRALGRIAVIVNEFGAVGIDHDLVAASTESVRLLPSGCLCCEVRTDLQETLRDLVARRGAGAIAFDRVVIETSGLADPVPVVHALLSDGMLAAACRVDCVATLVDAVNGAGQLEQFDEARKQVASADRLFVTKGDLAGAERAAALRARLAALNPYAEIADAIHGAVDPECLVDVSPRGPRAEAAGLLRWLRAAAPETDSPPRYLGAVAAKHRGDVGSFTLWFDAPFAWGAFANALQLLSNLRGPDLLRVKGLINVAGEAGPVVVQGAQHVFHPPLTLAAWPGDDRRSRLVFITRGIPRATVAQLFGTVASLTGPD